MDLTTIIMMVGFVVYGIIVYRQREGAYRRVLHRLARGETPVEKSVSLTLWRLVTLASVTFLLFAFVMGCVVLFFVRGLGAGGPTLILGGACVVPLVILVLIFLRDLREYRVRRGV